MAELKPVGKVVTARGRIEPAALGRVMMHEHLHSDCCAGPGKTVLWDEHPPAPERRQYLLDRAVPPLRECRRHGLGAYVDCTMPGWRAWPTLYREVSEAADVHIILSTGFYREMEVGRFWVRTPEDAIWPPVRLWPLEELAEFCIREITEGIHGTDIRAGTIKLGTSQPPMTELEIKAFRAGARAQRATGVSITTHCTMLGAETSQLMTLEREGVDLSRVIIGHTAAHLMVPDYRRSAIAWMKRGANFLPTNLFVKDPVKAVAYWKPLVEVIHELFQAGLGEKVTLGLDSGFASEQGVFRPMEFLPEPPWLHLFTHVLPAFREAGLTAEEETALLETNPQRLLPVR